MKSAPLLFVALLLFSSQRLSAQNTILVLDPGDSIESLLHATGKPQDSYYSFDISATVPKPPAGVQNGLPINCDLQDAANQSLSRFQRHHLYNGYVDFGRDFLDGGYVWNTNPDYEGASYRITHKKDSINKSKLMNTLFSNKAVQEAVYQWLFPSFRDAHSAMSVPEQKDYLEMLKAGIAFADTFNLETQTRVVEESENYASVAGSLNAFIYRRVVNRQLTRDDCIQWLNRILNDLIPAQTKNPRPEDDYVITSALGYGYFAATRYQDANGYGAEYSIMKVNGNRFELQPVPKFRMGNYDHPESNFIHGYIDDTSGYTRCFFYCDSAGWTFTRSPYNEDFKEYQLLGSGASARILIVYAYDFDYDDALKAAKSDTEIEAEDPYTSAWSGIVAIVDLDSGYILIDSIRVTETHHYSEYELISTEFADFNKDRVIFFSYLTNAYGVMDNRGKVLLPANYSSVEFTADPDIVKVNGKKNVSVHGGGKPPKPARTNRSDGKKK